MNSQILETARRLIENHRLCDSCLGRQFANLASGTSNSERGKSLKNILVLEAHNRILAGHEGEIMLLKKIASNGLSETARSTLEMLGYQMRNIEPSICELCHGNLQAVEKMAEDALNKIKDYDFESFLVGAKIPASAVEAEDSIRAKYGVEWGENIKSEFTREIGKAIAKLSSKQVDYRRPDITVIVSPFKVRIDFQVNAIFVEGRYRKLVVGVPQSRWLCRECRGKGCKLCGGTGKKYQESVHEIIEAPFLNASLGSATDFHAGGREDVDAKVLGRGRPFVIEIKNPKKRSFSLEKVRRETNRSRKVQVLGLSFTEKEAVNRVKSSEALRKTYDVLVEVDDGEITKEDLRKIEEALTGMAVHQATPNRVLHRRADKVRVKHVYGIKAKKLSQRSFRLIIQCEGGFYLKEFINGDDGRTTPSISELLQKKVKCSGLTVVDIGGGWMV